MVCRNLKPSKLNLKSKRGGLRPNPTPNSICTSNEQERSHRKGQVVFNPHASGPRAAPGEIARTSINQASKEDIMSTQDPVAKQVSTQTSHATEEPLAAVPDLGYAKESADELCTPYPNMTPIKIMGRQYQVVSFSVSDSFVSETLKFPRDLAAFKALECGAASFKFLRAGVKLTIRIQSTIQQAGLLCVSWLPQKGPDTVIPQQATGNNAVLLNYSTQDSAEIVIPWTNPLCWEDTNADDSICTVYFHPIVKTRAPATADDFVTVTVYAQYVDCTLTGPQVAQSNEESYARGVPSTVSSPFFQTMDGVANAVTGVSKILGMLDKPDAPTNTRFVNTSMSDINSFVSSDTVVPSVPYTVTAPHLLPNDYNLFPYGHSGMTMTQVAARPMWCAQKDVTAEGDRIEYSLNPFSPRTIAETPLDDYLSAVTGSCRYFRGSQKFFVHFCTDGFTSCRFRIGVHYGAWSDDILSSGDTISRVVDVKGSTTTSVLIPYLQASSWSTGRHTYPTFFVAAIGAPIGASIPAAATITVTLYRAGGPDTQFAWPTNAAYGPQSSHPIPKGKQVAQTCLNAHFASSFQPIVEGVKIGREHGSSMTSEIRTISQLLKIMNNNPTAVADIEEFPYKNNHFFLSRFFYMFKFWRGSYRVYISRYPSFANTGTLGLRSSISSGNGLLTSVIPDTSLPLIPSRLPAEQDGIHLTMPWYSTVPYLPNALEGPILEFYDRPVVTKMGPPNAGFVYIYPGDDFTLGHLVSPSTW